MTIQVTLGAIFAASEGDEEIVNPVIPEVNEIFWAALFFFALWALMKFVLLPPLMAARTEREEKISAAKDMADSVDSDLGSATSEYDAKISAARDEANGIVVTAREEAEARRSEIMGAADAEIAEMRNAADAEIAAARAGALGDLRGDVGDLATQAAGTVMGSPVDRSAAQPIIDRVLGS